MTLEDIEKMDCEFLPIPVVAEYLGMKNMSQCIRVAIRKGVPWGGYVQGKATFRVPRRAFVYYHKYGSIPK